MTLTTRRYGARPAAQPAYTTRRIRVCRFLFDPHGQALRARPAAQPAYTTRRIRVCRFLFDPHAIYSLLTLTVKRCALIDPRSHEVQPDIH